MPKNVVQCKEDRSEKEATLKYLEGHSITTLTKFCLIVDHLHIIDIGERIYVFLHLNNFKTSIFSLNFPK